MSLCGADAESFTGVARPPQGRQSPILAAGALHFWDPEKNYQGVVSSLVQETKASSWPMFPRRYKWA